MEKYLKATSFIDFEHESIQALISEFNNDNLSEKEKVIGIYLKIRDRIRYNATKVHITPSSYVSSYIATLTEGHCLDKSILLVSCLRGFGIPARLRLAKIKNHIGVEKIIAQIGTDELAPHGIVDVWLGGKWLKVSPAFDKDICKRFNVAPLDFDGENDSIFQEFNNEGKVFMEYLEDYGSFDDVPLDFIVSIFRSLYPTFFPKKNN